MVNLWSLLVSETKRLVAESLRDNFIETSELQSIANIPFSKNIYFHISTHFEIIYIIREIFPYNFTSHLNFSLVKIR